MRLYIAEKPSLAKAIAQGLGGGKQGEGCIVCGDNTVTWAFGHLLELLEPDEYDPALKQWARETLPIMPVAWKNKPKASSKAQLVIITKLLKAATHVVNAGDPDREGQLLIDEILEHCHYTGPVERLWLASLDTESVTKALACMKANIDYAPMRDAARARSRADWLVGINATRAMTIFGRTSGCSETLSLGRVQTPTLALVVERDRSIDYFKAQEYLVLQAHIQHQDGSFTTTFSPADTQAGLDTEKRLVDAAVASTIAKAVADKDGTIAHYGKEEKKQTPPLPHCLSSLQKLASSKYGMTAQSVLDTAQKLYDQGFTTYPRSDCRYLPEEQFADAPHILSPCADKVDCTLRSAAWNTQKITAHHAIIPTKQSPSTLSKTEQNLYDLIFLAYMQQFQKPLRYEAIKVVVSIAEYMFTATGRHILDAGYTAYLDKDSEVDEAAEKEQALPQAKQGDAVHCAQVDTLAKKTNPSPRFTEGTLIDAMAHIDRYIDDTAAKATLKESAGIGTEATRAKMLETLKKRGYIKADKKHLVSTDLGKQLIALCPPMLKDPVTTALWEQQLEGIALEKNTLTAFMDAQTQVLPTIIQSIFSNSTGNIAPQFPCPTCGKALLRKKGKQGFFWGCAAYPECKTTFPDEHGKPNTKPKPTTKSTFPCPTCGKPMVRHKGKDGFFWGCSAYRDNGCRQTLQDNNGKPEKRG